MRKLRPWWVAQQGVAGFSFNVPLAALTLTGQPPTTINSGASNFFADPYGAYSTRLVDGAIASNVAGGTTVTETWNGISASYQVYKTVGFGITDWLAGGASRRLGLLQQTYAQTANLVMPNTGTSDTTRCIIQGDPAATTSNMAKITFSGGHGFAVGNAQNGGSAAAQYVTFRKLDISTDNITSVNPIFAGPDFDYSGLVVEYCAVHDCIEAAGDNVGAIRIDGAVTGPAAIVRYCKLYNITTDGISGRNLNCSGIDSFQASNVQVYNCLMHNANNGVFVKRPGIGASNGWTIRNNIIFNTFNGVWLSFAGGGTDPNGHINDTIYQNLIYNLDAAGQAMTVDDNSNTAQNSGLQYYQNTIAEDCPKGWGVQDMTGAVIHSNVFLSSSIHVLTERPLAALTRITQCDYNRYLAGAQYWLDYTGSTFTQLTTLALWQAAHTNHPTVLDLSANPDAHGAACLLTDFPSRGTRDYTYANGIGQGLGGINIGYDPTNCGPGW